MAMKESGIEWVGLIPETWSVIPNKYVMHKEKNLCEKWTGEDVMSLTMNGVIVRDLQNPTGKMPATFDGYQYIEDGDLLMCLFDIDVTPRCVGKVTHNGVTSPAYSNFKVHDNASRDYFYYYYLMVDNTKELLHLAKNLRHSFTEEQLGQLKVPMPPLSEQQAIADYLDETCSQIDEIIAEAKASIDEYKELRQGVIFEAVTKGLDKNVEMKSTSVGWIGTVPLHWRVAKIRQVAEFYNGDRSSKYPSGDDIVSEGIIFITSNNLGYIVLNTNISTNKFITKQKYDDLGGAKLRINDIVFCLRGSVGKCAINKTFDEGTIASSLVVIRAKKVDADYLNYVLQNHRITDEAIVNAIGIGSLNLAAHDISEFYMPIPPEKEMQDIVRYLDDKVGNVDDLISEKESLINDLEAYKKSLIYEVVTGKRRVV